MALTHETMIENMIKACKRVVDDYEVGEDMRTAYDLCKLALDQVAQYTGCMCPGERNKLHISAKMDMVKMWFAEKTQKQIAKKYNISQPHVSILIKNMVKKIKNTK